jgi:hypothetical protein
MKICEQNLFYLRKSSFHLYNLFSIIKNNPCDYSFTSYRLHCGRNRTIRIIPKDQSILVKTIKQIINFVQRVDTPPKI